MKRCARVVVCNLCYSLTQIKHESQKIYGKSIQNDDDDGDGGISFRVELREISNSRNMSTKFWNEMSNLQTRF